MNILSFDGGISIVLALRLLRRVELLRPGFLSRVEFFSGISDGAVAALLLAARRGTPAQNLRALDDCIDVFHEIGAILRPGPRRLWQYARGRGSRSIAEAFEQLFERYLGAQAHLGELDQQGRKFAVLAYEKSTWRRRVFRSFDFESEAERRRTLVDVALACTAAIPILPPHRSPLDGLEYVDGAYVTNNPALVAVQEACAHLERHGTAAGDPLGQLKLLSLGTTVRSADPTAPGRGRLSGLPRWMDRLDRSGWSMLLGRALYLPDALFQGSVDTVDLQCAELLGARYHRVRCIIPEVEWLAGLILAPERMRSLLDEEAEKRFATVLPGLDWIDANVNVNEPHSRA
ncbi:patatin-like phospholipase family protein [Hyalangium versicolor]|uniref:patatin-like phospholipase family protein n=1 Tax=Hyalangium versicolor TaxID=2861190 RepID=UPI001CD022DD|nr:patatin-like phospholipase family protein [Hyalangium versicolor]